MGPLAKQEDNFLKKTTIFEKRYEQEEYFFKERTNKKTIIGRKDEEEDDNVWNMWQERTKKMKTGVWKMERFIAGAGCCSHYTTPCLHKWAWCSVGGDLLPGLSYGSSRNTWGTTACDVTSGNISIWLDLYKFCAGTWFFYNENDDYIKINNNDVNV